MEPYTRERHTTVETKRSDSLQLNFSILDADGAAKDLSTVTAARWGLCAYGASTLAVTKSISAGGVAVTDAAAGEISVVVPAVDMDLAPGLYEDELEITIGADVQTAAYGFIVVLEDKLT